MFLTKSHRTMLRFVVGLFGITLFLSVFLAVYYLYNQFWLFPEGPESGRSEEFIIKTGPSFGQYETKAEHFSIFNTHFYLLEIESEEDEVFPQNSLRLKIGFYDNDEILHVYPARIGGVENETGRVINASFCITVGESKNHQCRGYPAFEIKTLLEPNKIMEGGIIYEDVAPWKAADQTRKHQEVILQLKEAVRSGENFPTHPLEPDFVLQIWNLRKL